LVQSAAFRSIASSESDIWIEQYIDSSLSESAVPSEKFPIGHVYLSLIGIPLHPGRQGAAAASISTSPGLYIVGAADISPT
jgi:hypothetical protein